MLEDLKELVAKESLTDAQKDTANKSINALFEAFGSLDKTIHSGKGKTYSDLATEIDKAIADLQEIFPQPSQQEASP
ncbi:MAG: hypothetical protein FJ267_08960 [Planctomycetes bacterium]|nr:hypothetical protein [Planctomycetota bacterium]